MKIYFAGSIRGGRADADLYLQIIEFLRNYGEVLTEHVGAKNLSVMGKDGKTSEFIHDRDLKWIIECDVMIAEVSTASLGVGYEISKGIEHGKKILCLYRPQEGKSLSAMIAGCPDVTNASYSDLEEAKRIIGEWIADAKK